MSLFSRTKAKWDELIGRAEELYGETHGDAAAEVHGEAKRLEGEAEEEIWERHDTIKPPEDGSSPAR